MAEAGLLTRLRARWAARDASLVRSNVGYVNDGILSVAGFSEGLVGAGLATSRIYEILLLSALAGAISVAGKGFVSAAADREVEQAALAEESRLLAMSPDEELAELTTYYEAKGLRPETARTVAEELTACDALTAQLETEYGIRTLHNRRYVVGSALRSGSAYLLGATVPLLVAYLWPGPWLDRYTLAAVVVSLSVTAVILARLGGTKVVQTLLRSLLIGSASLGASYLVAQWLL